MFKVNGKTYLSGISQFAKGMLIEMNIERSEVGRQLLKFTFGEDKQSTFIEMSTQVELSGAKTKRTNAKKLIFSLQNN